MEKKLLEILVRKENVNLSIEKDTYYSFKILRFEFKVDGVQSYYEEEVNTKAFLVPGPSQSIKKMEAFFPYNKSKQFGVDFKNYIDTHGNQYDSFEKILDFLIQSEEQIDDLYIDYIRNKVNERNKDKNF